MLQVKALNKRFASTHAVKEVSLEIAKGEMVGVIGSSGAGKSTMLRLLNRLIEPSSGQVIFDGRDITALKGKELRHWRAQCAMIFQQFNLVPRLDVLTNVLLGRVSYNPTLPMMIRHFSASDRALAAQALERVNLLPQALQRADTLSGGQQQRVAIARALIQQPQIILADEPIASLDPRNAQMVMDSLREINQRDGLTVLCNLHTLDTAKHYCDRIVAMQHGAVVFNGSPEQLDSKTIRAIYGGQSDAQDLIEGITSTSLTAKVAVPA